MTKNESRKKYLAQRLKFSKEEIFHFSYQISQQILSNFQFSNSTISIFLPIEGKNEVNLYGFIDELKKQSVKIVVPKADFRSLEMSHYIYTDASQLEISSYGIPEPIFGEKVTEEAIDFVIVPLVIFDQKGYRSGYGKGFYDRFLAKCSPSTQFIGVSFFEPIEKLSDVHLNDIKLHYCITPKTIYKF